MKELSSIVKVEIKNPSDFNRSLHKDLKDYEIKYNSYSVIWKIKNDSFKHSFWYNPGKHSKVKTSPKREYKEVIWMNIALLTVFFTILFGNLIFEWYSNDYLDVVMEVFGGLIVAINWLYFKFKPHKLEELQDEHNKIVNYFKSFAE